MAEAAYRREQLIFPKWPAPQSVQAWVSTRPGGFSQDKWSSWNLADYVGDDPAAVSANRTLLRQLACLPGEPVWLNQVHSDRAILLSSDSRAGLTADAAVTCSRNVVCAVLTADCLPILLCDCPGLIVGIVHAGWRGLVAGIIERTVAAMSCRPSQIMAWLGPAIGPQVFEVGADVVEACTREDPHACTAFAPLQEGRWLADIYQLARLRLRQSEVEAIYGGGLCTLTDRQRFFSYRRDGITGRIASLIWLK